ncbi:bifunctional nicotinamidase/pyrazinamidase [bacterium]|nr:bifunctional nicotinamidase/pyrazinamidase [bacterium]
MKKALLLIDIQNDFLPTGALPVKDGDKVIAIANREMNNFDFIIATQDWHPKNHESFASMHTGKNPGEIIDLYGLTQVLWPNHCIQNTEGASLSPLLDLDKIDIVIQKGTDPTVDSYSGFFDNGRKKETKLNSILKENGVNEIFVMGLATDYCVKFTVLDALSLGYKVNLIQDGCRGVELNLGDIENALNDMKKAGANLI